MVLKKSSGGSQSSLFHRGPAPAPPKLLRAPAPAPKQQQGPPAPRPLALRTMADSQRARSTPKPLPRVKQEPRQQPQPFFQLTSPGQERRFDREPPSVEVAPEIDRGPRTIDQALRKTWGSLENEGLSGYTKLRETGGTPDSLRNSGDTMAEYYNMQARMGQREAARRAREAADREETIQELSPEEWARLSPAQQAAVQANYDLSQAVARDYDRSLKHNASPEQIKSYQDRVRRLFGENATINFRGLAYAPNTVAFLDARGLRAIDLAGKTLDDFLSGDALVTMEDIERISDKVPKYSKEESTFRVPGATRDQNLSFAQQLSRAQLAYQDRLAATLDQGDKLLADLTSRGTIDRAAASYGANPDYPRVSLDNLRSDVTENFDQYLEILARTDMPTSETLQVIEADLRERGATNEETAQIWEGMIERARQAATGEGDWFSGIDWPMRSPLEVAEILGAPMLTRGTTTTTEK